MSSAQALLAHSTRCTTSAGGAPTSFQRFVHSAGSFFVLSPVSAKSASSRSRRALRNCAPDFLALAMGVLLGRQGIRAPPPLRPSKRVKYGAGGTLLDGVGDF